MYNIKKDKLSYRIKNDSPIVRVFDISFYIPTYQININKRKYNLFIEKRVKAKYGKDAFECWVYHEDGSTSFEVMTYEMIDQYCLEQYKKLHNIN